MGSFSDYAELKILDHITGKLAFTTVSPCWIALITSANTPTDASTNLGTTEPTTPNGYARKITVSADWESAASGATQNTSVLTFATATNSGWGSVGHFALMDAATPGQGNMIAWGTLTTPKTIAAGDTASFAAGDLDITLD